MKLVYRTVNITNLNVLYFLIVVVIIVIKNKVIVIFNQIISLCHINTNHCDENSLFLLIAQFSNNEYFQKSMNLLGQSLISI